jgi:O-antigen ligase
MLDALRSSRAYGTLKKIYVVLLLSFRETFIYKMFMGELKYRFEDSRSARALEALKSAVKKLNGVLTASRAYRYARARAAKTGLSAIIENSAVLRFFGVSGDGYGFSFFMFLLLVFAAALVPTMTVAALVVVVSASLVLEREPHFSALRPIFADALVALYLAALSYGLLISKSPDRLNVFLIYAAFVGSYYIVRYFIVSERRGVMFASYFTLAGAFVCLYAFYQYLTGDMGAESWTDSTMFKAIELRVYSTFQNPNVLGEYLLFLIPMSFSLAALAKRKLHKSVYFIIFCASAATMLLTYSRGCWIGLIIGSFLYVALLYRKLTAAAVIAAPFSIFILPRSIIARFQSIGDLGDSSTSYRVSIWRGTVSLLRKIWPSGTGIGTYAYELAYMPYAYSGVTAQHAHNSYLHILTETGIFGFATLMLLIFVTVRNLFLTYKNSGSETLRALAASLLSGMAGYLTQGFFDNTFYNYRMYLIFFIMTAFSCALSEIRREGERG